MNWNAGNSHLFESVPLCRVSPSSSVYLAQQCPLFEWGGGEEGGRREGGGREEGGGGKVKRRRE